VAIAGIVEPLADKNHRQPGPWGVNLVAELSSLRQLAVTFFGRDRTLAATGRGNVCFGPLGPLRLLFGMTIAIYLSRPAWMKSSELRNSSNNVSEATKFRSRER
jgi:hypothetical protein